jgi:hypothetical protein
MKKALAVAVLLGASSAAWAVDVPFPNGTFESQGSLGFTQAINNWTVSYTGTQGAGLPLSQQSGLFTSLGKFGPPQGNTFAFLSNLGGSGRVEMKSNGLGSNFDLGKMFRLQFRYAYITNDPTSAATKDRFLVQIEFYGSASSVVVANTAIFDLTNQVTANLTDTGSFSPFNTGGATNTFNNGTGTGGAAYNLVSLDMSPFLSFGTFARVSFIVDSNGPAAGTSGNGLGVSGVVLDNVVVNPEPSAIALFALGAMGLGGFAWRRRTAKKPAA